MEPMSDDDDTVKSVTVVGIGAMGMGMAESLLRSEHIGSVVGYDRSEPLMRTFHSKACAANKQGGTTPTPPQCLAEALSDRTEVVVLVLVNEKQCEQVCFGGGDGNDNDDDDNDNNNNLASLLSKRTRPANGEGHGRGGIYVVLCSTVSPAWAQSSSERFRRLGVTLVDCPVSGGPARAQEGTLSLFASCDRGEFLRHSEGSNKSSKIRRVLDAMGHVHVIEGGCGRGSTVKAVHQLLAGVHIVAAAEAMALAAAAGIDPDQMYDIVVGAAGNSWMFRDRAPRMIASSSSAADPVPVKSAVAIFVKDLGIVQSLAQQQKVHCPLPMAQAALSQFWTADAMGLGRSDDSQVVKVYEQVTGVKVVKVNSNNSDNNNNNDNETKENARLEENNGDDVFVRPDGTREPVLEVGDEPSHHLTLQNAYTRVLTVRFGPGHTTLAHRHVEDSLYFFLSTSNGDNDDNETQPKIHVVNHVRGSAPRCDCMGFGEVRYGGHKSIDKVPLVHAITNASPDHNSDMDVFCIDAEIRQRPPLAHTAMAALQGVPHHELIKTRHNCRVYRFRLRPGEHTSVLYPFFHLRVVVRGGTLRRGRPPPSSHNHNETKELEEEAPPDSPPLPPPHKRPRKRPKLTWDETHTIGDVHWMEPSTEELYFHNVGDTTFEAYIAEWC